MNGLFKRYDETMLQALATQPVFAILINAVIRAVAFTLAIEFISILSGFAANGLVQMLILVLVFSVMIFSFDIIEKYWAQNRLKKRF